MSSYAERAKILSEALPYIRRFNGKTIVIKYGGNAMVSEGLSRAVISDIVLLHLVGINVVVVHGGGPEINAMLTKINKKSEFVDGLRYTDEETMDIVQQVLCGKVNKNLVAMVNRAGGRAIGLCGIDGGMMKAKVKDERYGLVGELTKVDGGPVLGAIKNGYIPVISTVAQGVDADTSYNINADTAAAQIAVACGAEKLFLLTDIAGLMMDPKDESTLISDLEVGKVPELVEAGVISGGMIPKIECCVDALNAGVKRVHILDGRVEHSILIEMLTDAGIGTMMYKEGE